MAEILRAWSGLGYGLVGQSAALTLTNSTANLSLGTFTVPANGWAVGDIYQFEALVHASRGATATAANLVIELLINAVVIRTTTLAISTTASTNRAAHVLGSINCLSLGATGSAQVVQLVYHDITGTANAVSRDLQPAPGTASPTATTVDTTVARSIELRARMSAAVAALTIYATQASLTRSK